ncbi:MAG: CRISPR-associated endonuclease Cas2 [Actinomycetota bacterium]|nr:MAG: CRISPR-associated endonuclease Cas2 [Actinomycetota bacterium]
MNVVVAYDVSTATAAGERRLRRVARICEGYGQRVQYSVFEVVCSQTDLAKLVAKLEDEIEPTEDSLRLYPIHGSDLGSVIQLGRRRDIPNEDAWTL